MQLPSTVILQTCLIFQRAYIAYCYTVSSRVNRQLVRETPDEKKTQAFQMNYFEDAGTLLRRAHRTRPSYNVAGKLNEVCAVGRGKSKMPAEDFLSPTQEIAHELLPSRWECIGDFLLLLLLFPSRSV